MISQKRKNLLKKFLICPSTSKYDYENFRKGNLFKRISRLPLKQNNRAIQSIDNILTDSSYSSMTVDKRELQTISLTTEKLDRDYKNSSNNLSKPNLQINSTYSLPYVDKSHLITRSPQSVKSSNNGNQSYFKMDVIPEIRSLSRPIARKKKKRRSIKLLSIRKKIKKVRFQNESSNRIGKDSSFVVGNSKNNNLLLSNEIKLNKKKQGILKPQKKYLKKGVKSYLNNIQLTDQTNRSFDSYNFKFTKRLLLSSGNTNMNNYTYTNQQVKQLNLSDNRDKKVETSFNNSQFRLIKQKKMKRLHKKQTGILRKKLTYNTRKGLQLKLDLVKRLCDESNNMIDSMGKKVQKIVSPGTDSQLNNNSIIG